MLSAQTSEVFLLYPAKIPAWPIQISASFFLKDASRDSDGQTRLEHSQTRGSTEKRNRCAAMKWPSKDTDN